MIGNPRGYGKSSLVKEFLYRRDKICKEKDQTSGPVLFTDFSQVQSVVDAEEKILETIRPLFISYGFESTRDHGILYSQI